MPAFLLTVSRRCDRMKLSKKQRRYTMKKLILALSLSILLAFAVSAATEVGFSPNGQIIRIETEITITLNGKPIDCESYGASATIVNGRTLVPLRAIFEALGASGEWDNATKTVTSKLYPTLTIDGKTFYGEKCLGELKLTIGSDVLYKDGAPIALDVPATIMDGRTMVPARAIAEGFGVDVKWDAASRTVILTQNPPQSVVGVWYSSNPMMPIEEMISGKKTTYVGKDVVMFRSVTLTDDGKFEFYEMHDAWMPDEEGNFSYSGAAGAGIYDGTYTVVGDTVTLYDPYEAISGTWYWSTPEIPLEELKSGSMTTYVGERFAYGYINFDRSAIGNFYTYYRMGCLYLKGANGTGMYDGAMGADMLDGAFILDGNTITLHNFSESYPIHNEDGSWEVTATITFETDGNTMKITDVDCNDEEFKQKILKLPTLRR